jgi:predicted transposase/invertase (TIGR01784 family)
MEEKNVFYTCKNDRAFKEVFMKEENKDLLIALLESILNIKIEELNYLNLEKNVDNINIKKKYFDLHVRTKNENIQIEVNPSVLDYTRPRNVSYICDTYSHEVLKGDNYNEESKIIQINFTYGLMKSNKYYEDVAYRVYKIQDEEGKKYVENFTIYEYNMDYLMKVWYYKNEKEIAKYKYIIMMDLKKEELEKLSKKDRVIDKYMEEVVKVNENPEFHQYMSWEEDQRKIKNSLEKQYREEGAHLAKLEDAKKMKEDGLDIKTISKYTSLTIEEIEKL